MKWKLQVFTNKTDEGYEILIYGQCLPQTIAGVGVASETARSKSRRDKLSVTDIRNVRKAGKILWQGDTKLDYN